MKIKLIRYANSMDPNATYLKDSNEFIDEINNELFDDDISLDESGDERYPVVFIETGGSEQKFIKDVDKYVDPIVIISNSKNNSLPACFEIRTYLEDHNRQSILLFGLESDVAMSLKQIFKYFTARNELKDANLGVIGTPSDWLIASKVDYDNAKKYFGVNLIDISTSELKEEINKGMIDDIPHEAELYKTDFSKEVIKGALEIYSGLKRIINKYSLSGFTLRCFDLIEEYKNTACLAFALLNEEGIIASCEGDVPALLTMMLVKSLTNSPSFMANPSKIDLRESTILFAHCTVPLNMCKKYELMTHFESGLGIGVRGELDLNKITICKIAPNLKDFLCVKGDIKENLKLDNYCRTQILVNMEREDMFDFLKEIFGNHVIISYGDNKDDLITAFHFCIDGNEEKK